MRPSLSQLALAVALFAGALCPAAVVAHIQPVPLEKWGAMLPETVGCLRRISQATHACFDRVFPLLQDCNDALARGATCDMDAVDAEISTSTRPLRQALTRDCQLGQLTEIGYIGVADAEADLFAACVTQARSAIAAIYAPALAGPPAQDAVECMAASGTYARKVIRFVLRHEVPIMERIAARLFTEDEKRESILRIERELSAARARWIVGLGEACPDFASVYGRSPDSFLRTMKQRADCVLSRTYVHTGINCPAAICGNGIPEVGEQCDDGNRDDTDTCLTNCRLP